MCINAHVIRRRRAGRIVLIAAGAVLLGAGSVRSEAASPQLTGGGGTFKISFLADDFPTVDPALAYGSAWSVLDATCARLMNYPDKPPPEGLRVVPEVATAYPRVSDGGKTYTFTLRRGFRFNDGTPVEASAFARAINRILAPGVDSGGLPYVKDIVGAAAVRAGTATAAAGVVADGSRLTIRFSAAPADFAAQLTMPLFCAVPPDLPSDPEGVGAFASAGPYYISEYVRGQRVVLERNRFYRGLRPHRVDGFVVDLVAAPPQELLHRVERGEADWSRVAPPLYFDPAQGLVRKYGVNRSQFLVSPGLLLRGYMLNVARPLFKNNLALRRAVNFAVDRPAILRSGGLAGPLAGRATDQYLPPTIPGFRDAHIYPLGGPNLARARALARGHTRSGKAVLGTINVPGEIAAAQIVKQNLRRIGLDVEIKGLPPGAFFGKAAAPGAPFDIALALWVPDYVDPSEYTNFLFDSRFIGSFNLGNFDSPKYNALMRRAARLQGEARYRAYGQLDVQLARDGVPMVMVNFFNDPTLVSKRAGCVLIRPGGLLGPGDGLP